MLIQLFDIFQISHLSPKILPRLLYEFKEPFDKELAIKDWKYGGETKLEYKKLVFFYRHIYNKLFEILDIVFTPYIINSRNFVPPHPIVITDFTAMLQFFFMIQNNWKIGITYNIDFRPFNPINGDYERLIADWKRLRGKFLDYQAKLDEYCFLQGVGNYRTPYRIERFDKAIKNNLNKQKEFQKAKQLPSNRPSLKFTARHSKKKSVYLLLDKSHDEWITSGEILKKVAVSYDSLRSIIWQLRQDLIKQDLSNKLSLKTMKKDGYKLHFISE